MNDLDRDALERSMAMARRALAPPDIGENRDFFAARNSRNDFIARLSGLG